MFGATASTRRGIDFVAEFAQPLQFVDQGAAAYAKSPGGFRTVVIMTPQGQQDGLVLDVFQTLCIGGRDGGGLMLGRANAAGQMLEQKEFTAGKQRGPFHGVAQFAHVARPRVA